MTFYGDSDIGNIRKHNEDSYTVKRLGDDCLVAVIADGMGGHRGGKKASETASETAFEIIKDEYGKFSTYGDDDFKELLIGAVNKANTEVYEISKTDEELRGMGTTMVVCVIYKCRYYVANVGDSRLYVYSKHLRQITKDHSYVSELVDMGIISEQEALVHPKKNVITRAVGTEFYVESDFYTDKLASGDKILICTDGLSNMVSFEELEKTLSESIAAEDIVEKLMASAKENGGKDNISIVVIDRNCEGGDLE